MHAEIWVDGSYAPVSTSVTGGKLITPDEYDNALAAADQQQTPAE